MILTGDARALPLADESVHCCITSPPYWSLRDYGANGQLGLERVPDCLGWATGAPCGECYICRMVAVFREVKRVLRPEGVAFVNMGDSYATNPGNGRGGETVDGGLPHRSGQDKTHAGLKPKDLCMIPARLALALQADGWWLRSDIIWSKPNPMPESVTDRPTKSHEYVFLLSKSARYYYDQEAVREAYPQSTVERSKYPVADHDVSYEQRSNGWVTTKNRAERKIVELNPSGRNRRTVWEIATQPFSGAHFATFPEELVKVCLLAGSSDKGCCPVCGKPWERVVEKEFISSSAGRNNITGQDFYEGREGVPRGSNNVTTVGWRATCTHDATPVPCTVFDPFAGSGTVGLVARKYGRRFVGVELNPTYCRMAQERVGEGRQGRLGV